MLYEEFDGYKKFVGVDVFKDKAGEFGAVLKNLNPEFLVRDYQKEALGRFFYYFGDYPQRVAPMHLMFNMATGSGKTLIMAAAILFLYKQGYRDFVFFTRLDNIIQKTKDNFLNPLSKKYLFAPKIIIDGRAVQIKEVDNFEAASSRDINIIFSTTALLHQRFNSAKENALTYEDFGGKKVALIADEAHNLSAETNAKLGKTELADKASWENTAMRILNANPKKENMLLEFTATARLENDYPEILEKYKNKAIFRYDLKQYRLDGFSKDVRTLQINAALMERVLVAAVISQYRLKVAQKHRLAIKPVVMFKANRVTSAADKPTEILDVNPQIVVSGEFKAAFHKLISGLDAAMLARLAKIQDATLQKAFQFFEAQQISLENLARELKVDFAPEKCLSVDEGKDEDQKQLLLNSLEDRGNEIRAVFATEKLNEGWDVLNLFDIVRLYNTRSEHASRTDKIRKPGKTTVQEAQLIGRGARYCPFAVGEYADKYKRKFDGAAQDELRILEQLYYHSMHNPDYISELTKVLVREGIVAANSVRREIKIKDEFKKKDFWKTGLIFLNSRKANLGEDIWSLNDIKNDFKDRAQSDVYVLPTREAVEQDIFGKASVIAQGKAVIREFEIREFGDYVIRAVLDRFAAGKFEKIKRVFGNLESLEDFIIREKYLGGVKVKIKGMPPQLDNMAQAEKIYAAGLIADKVLMIANAVHREYSGTKNFKAHLIRKVFEKDKVLQLDADSPRAQNMRDFDFGSRDWMAQNEIWGTSEEEAFLRFMDGAAGKLKEKYADIALLRNEQFFKIYDFSGGEPFYPDFVLFLKEKQTKREIAYQVFVEPKGDQFLDADKTFEQSKEGWKQKFLLEIEKTAKTDFDMFKIENKDFCLIGLPFFNEGQMNNQLRENFEKSFNDELLN